MCTPFPVMVTPNRVSSDTSSRWMKWFILYWFIRRPLPIFLVGVKRSNLPLQLFRKLQIDFFKNQFLNEKAILVALDAFQGNFRKFCRNFFVTSLKDAVKCCAIFINRNFVWSCATCYRILLWVLLAQCSPLWENFLVRSQHFCQMSWLWIVDRIFWKILDNTWSFNVI